MSDTNNESKMYFDEISGESHTIKVWAEILGIPFTTLYGRIVNYNWPIEKALYGEKYASVNRKPRPKDTYHHMDITGKRFGNLTVIEKSPSSTNSKPLWTCMCDCGNIIDVDQGNLTSRRKTKCDNHKRGEIIDLTGKKFGAITVTHHFLCNDECMCTCDCGLNNDPLFYDGKELRSGKINDCGCGIGNGKVIHPDVPLIRAIHDKMLCDYEAQFIDPSDPLNPYNSLDYRNDITPEWFYGGFINFYNWAINNGYEKGKVLRMYDYRGNYCPENCFLDYPNNHYGEHVLLTYRGLTMTIYQWSLYFKIDSIVMYNRYTNGWNNDDIFQIPVDFERKIIKSSKGVFNSVAWWSKISGINPIELYKRVFVYGWSIDYSLTYESPNIDEVRKYTGHNQDIDLLNNIYGIKPIDRFDFKSYNRVFGLQKNGMPNAISYVDYFGRMYTPEEWEKRNPEQFT